LALDQQLLRVEPAHVVVRTVQHYDVGTAIAQQDRLLTDAADKEADLILLFAALP
jgi:hypothetical protein